MVSALLVLAVAALALAFAWSLLRTGDLELPEAADWDQKRHDVDVRIFRALLDPDEERYLHDVLTPKQFRLFQRKRIRLVLEMLGTVEHNAGLLIRLGRLARLKHDPSLTQTADELVDTAIQFRLSLVFARPFLYTHWLFPGSRLVFAANKRHYEHLLASLARVQQNCSGPQLMRHSSC